MTYSFDFFISFGILSLLLFIGILCRKVLPFLQKWMLPACMIGGVLGFILMNSGLTDLKTTSFEEITYHLFNLSYMSLILTPTAKKEQKKSTAFRGGLWMALISGLMLSVQALCGAGAFLLTNGLGFTKNAPIWMGFLITHGFTQGTGQSLAIGNSWSAFGIEHAGNVGMFYAAIGFFMALIIGITQANKAKTEQKTVILAKDIKTGTLQGIYPENERVSAGFQTTHPDNIDALSFHLAILGICYFITYFVAYFLSNNVLSSSESLKALPFSLFFLPGMFVCLIVKQLLKLFRLEHLLDAGIQSRITGFTVDFLMVSSMASISFSVLLPYLPGILIAVILVVGITFFLIRFLASRLPELQVERFLCQFGCCTGNTASGLLLLRQVDPDYETTCGKELVIFNLLFTFTGIIYLVAPVAPKFGVLIWFFILVMNSLIMLGLLWIFGFLKKKKGTAE